MTERRPPARELVHAASTRAAQQGCGNTLPCAARERRGEPADCGLECDALVAVVDAAREQALGAAAAALADLLGGAHLNAELCALLARDGTTFDRVAGVLRLLRRLVPEAVDSIRYTLAIQPLDRAEACVVVWKDAGPPAIETVHGPYSSRSMAEIVAQDERAATGRSVTVERASAPPNRRPPVPRGHCDRCDRCGWKFDHHPNGPASGCHPGDCSMRPLPERRDTCAGCGAPFVDACKPTS